MRFSAPLFLGWLIHTKSKQDLIWLMIKPDTHSTRAHYHLIYSNPFKSGQLKESMENHTGSLTLTANLSYSLYIIDQKKML